MRWPFLACLIYASCQFDRGAERMAPGDRQPPLTDGGTIDRVDYEPPATDASAAADAPFGPPDAEPEPPDAPAPVGFCDPSDETLRACFRFEDASLGGGMLADESMHANHAISSDVTAAEGRSGAAARLGEQSRIAIAETSTLDPMAEITIELFIAPDAMPQGEGRAGLVDNQNQYGLFLHSSNGDRGELRCTAGGGVVMSNPGVVALNRWTHVACTADATTITLYVDGRLERQASRTGPLSTAGMSGVSIGSNSPCNDAPCGSPFIGRIDGLRIFSDVRSAEQICRSATPGSDC